MKKSWLLGLVFLLAVPGVLANSILDSVFSKIIGVGNLSFLGMSDASVVVGFTRIMVGLLIFTIFFAVLTTMSGKKGTLGFLNRGQAGVVAGIVAIIAAVFMPASVLLATGTGWATAVALVLIGGPIVGLMYALYKIPGRGKETKGTVMIKIVICLLLFWILSAMKFHVGRLI